MDEKYQQRNTAATLSEEEAAGRRHAPPLTYSRQEMINCAGYAVIIWYFWHGPCTTRLSSLPVSKKGAKKRILEINGHWEK